MPGVHREVHDHLLELGRVDSAGRERLLRYCARPPFALERLSIERHVGAREQLGFTAPPGEAAIRLDAHQRSAIRLTILRTEESPCKDSRRN